MSEKNKRPHFSELLDEDLSGWTVKQWWKLTRSNDRGVVVDFVGYCSSKESADICKEGKAGHRWHTGGTRVERVLVVTNGEMAFEISGGWPVELNEDQLIADMRKDAISRLSHAERAALARG